MSSSSSIFGKNSKLIPDSAKKILKKTIFYIPGELQKKDNLEKQLRIKNDMYNDAKSNSQDLYQSLIDGLLRYKIKLSESKTIISKNNEKYKLNLFKVPFLEYYVFDDKPIAYLEVFNKNLITASGDGYFFKSSIDNLKPIISSFEKIPTNIHKFNEYTNIKSPGWLSIKDIKVNDNIIYVSITEEVKKDCYNLSILKSDLNELKEFKFEKFYNMKQCTSSNATEFLGWQSGGRIEILDDHILLSVGDYRNRSLPQNADSLFGKIIAIDINSKNALVISKGHRNIQGLVIANDNIILSSEHGPAGGDEINVHRNILDIKEIENYGWPISSYGRHYQKAINKNIDAGTYENLMEIAPLKKSHKKYGFIEPVRYFSPSSVAASEIEKSNNVFDSNYSNDFYFGVLRNNFRYGGRLYHFKFNKNFDQILKEDEIILNERIRDIIIPNESKNMYLFLESIPAIGIIQKHQ